jgi:hypothetical protein
LFCEFSGFRGEELLGSAALFDNLAIWQFGDSPIREFRTDRKITKSPVRKIALVA